MKSRQCPTRAILCLVLAALLSAAAAAASVAPPDPRQELKKEFATFFSRVDDQSLEMLGAMKRSPAALKAIDARIDAMTDEEVATLRKNVGNFPTPGALTEMFPVAARESMKKAAADAVDPRAAQTRDEVLALVQILVSLPDAKLRELGIERTRVESIRMALAQMSLQDAALLQSQLDSTAPQWQEKSAEALKKVPPVVRRGMAALAKHGPISAEESKELEKFRGEVVADFQRIEALPADLRSNLNAEGLPLKIAELATVTPDALFIMRQELTPDKMRALDENLRLLERVQRLTPEDITDLDQFRTELIAAYAPAQNEAQAAPDISGLSKLDPAGMLVLRQRLGSSAEMTVAVPAVYRTLSTPGFAERVVAVQKPDPEPAAVQELENFRAQALQYVAAADVEPDLAARARGVLEKASLGQLEFIRSVNANLPEQASARTRLTMVSNVDLDCKWCVNLWVTDACIDINWICTPLENAINAVGGAISTAVETAKATLTAMINNVYSTLYGIIIDINNGVDALTATVTNIIAGLVNTVTLIWEAVSTIGTTVANAVWTAVSGFLDIHFPDTTYSLLDILAYLTTSSRIYEGLDIVKSNLVDHEWSRLDTQLFDPIQCPADGTITAFGVVGSKNAAIQAERYQYFLDELIGLAPSTEVSLYAKWRVYQVMEDWKVLSTCLKQSVEAQAEATETGRFNGLANQSNTNTIAVQTAISSATTTLSGAITGIKTDLTNTLNGLSDDAQALQLRLIIELNLASKEPLAIFELPQSKGGYIELVGQIVNKAITDMLGLSQPVGQASKYYNEAMAAMALGKYKDAYGLFQTAYGELSKLK